MHGLDLQSLDLSATFRTAYRPLHEQVSVRAKAGSIGLRAMTVAACQRANEVAAARDRRALQTRLMRGEPVGGAPATTPAGMVMLTARVGASQHRWPLLEDVTAMHGTDLVTHLSVQACLRFRGFWPWYTTSWRWSGVLGPLEALPFEAVLTTAYR